MDYLRHKRKMEKLKDAEAAGEVADSMEVRMALVKRMHAGELTLEEVQTELAKIKRNAKKNGQTTRDKAYRRA